MKERLKLSWTEHKTEHFDHWDGYEIFWIEWDVRNYKNKLSLNQIYKGYNQRHLLIDKLDCLDAWAVSISMLGCNVRSYLVWPQYHHNPLTK